MREREMSREFIGKTNDISTLIPKDFDAKVLWEFRFVTFTTRLASFSNPTNLFTPHLDFLNNLVLNLMYVLALVQH